MCFLRCVTGEISVISELFSFKSFVKILIFRFTISIYRFRITLYFTGNLPGIYQKTFGNFSENPYTPTYKSYPSPISPNPTHLPHPWTHPELQTQFSQKYKNCWKYRFLPNTFICSWNIQVLHSNLCIQYEYLTIRIWLQPYCIHTVLNLLTSIIINYWVIVRTKTQRDITRTNKSTYSTE